MQNKLQELTDKLYNEGLSKGKEEGDRYLNEAKAQAAAIVEQAKAEAAQIKASAEKEAADLKSKAASDVRMSAEQALQATKKDIEQLITGRISGAKVDTALEDIAFVKEIISAVAARFSASESMDLALVLPEKLKDQLEPWVGSELSKTLSTEVKASFSKKIAGGFTIGPKDGAWYVSLTDATFKELIASYLRPVTRKMLFGE